MLESNVPFATCDDGIGCVFELPIKKCFLIK